MVIDMIINDDRGLGRIEVSNIPLPDEVKRPDGTYTYSGKVLVTYNTEGDINIPDYYNVAIINDDGTEFKLIFSGLIPKRKKANGIRFMPFQDNKRVLLGDHVLECYPNIDECASSAIIPVVYPKGIEEDERATAHWSEIIIAPDNKSMSWTILRSDIGAVVAIGDLVRKDKDYRIENAQIISTVWMFEKDQENDGYIIPQTLRGGEVKQFIHGGRALSVVGQKDGNTPNSVIQDLASEETIQITHTPGYDETTIFSPDERLGIIMSARGSKKTNLELFGLMPRPHGAHTSMGISTFMYLYAVAGVREFRKGNVGPVLIDINRSMKEEGYQGVQLNDPEENWVYLSPMSWHPDGKRAMWPEMLRGSNKFKDGIQKKLRKATLLDYQPQETVPYEQTPDEIPYGMKELNILQTSIETDVEGRIAGKHSGYIHYIKKAITAEKGITESSYENYSDDGENFYNGYEKINYDYRNESSYEANIDLTGEQPGEMKLRVTFSAVAGYIPVYILFENAKDGKPKSYGYVQYKGERLNVDDLRE